ncbi:MAG: YicC family protein [Eubacteriaceae bacterium]|jgi:uncharacterized protein (TIGR00255 family)|nr:YicC family protein [Eubacteriaceae bacterium]
MNSMTGFGRGEFKDEKIMVVAEIKTVNHRYRDFFIKIPRQFQCFEEELRTLLGSRLLRGRIELYVNIKFLQEKPVHLYVDVAMAKQYHSMVREIAQLFDDVENDFRLSMIARYPDVIRSEEENEKYLEYWPCIEIAVKEALENIAKGRYREGQHLKKDIVKKCERIRMLLQEVEKHADEIPANSEAKIREIIAKYELKEVDANRMAAEIAFLAERAAIDEEIIRLKGHIEALEQALEAKGDIGRKLDFILQEMNREANTIASKSNITQISMTMVDIKSDIEKIREQVQNIE